MSFLVSLSGSSCFWDKMVFMFWLNSYVFKSCFKVHFKMYLNSFFKSKFVLKSYL